MSVRFLLGASGSGKSRQIYNEIIQASIKEPERNFYLIVPEQYTMEAQRAGHNASGRRHDEH